MGSAPLAGSVAPKLRAGACSQLKMVDWSEPSKEEEYTGAGSDRGQMNKADEIWDRVNNRIVSAASEAEAKGVGQKSGLDPTGKLREGDRDPVTPLPLLHYDLEFEKPSGHHIKNHLTIKFPLV